MKVSGSPVGATQAVQARPGLTLAVAKRLLKRAVDRNRFRRIAREAWRARQLASEGLIASKDGATASAGVVSPVPSSSVSLFVRLMRTAPQWKTLPVGAVKREWRAELDRLFAAVNLSGERRKS